MAITITFILETQPISAKIKIRQFNFELTLNG